MPHATLRSRVWNLLATARSVGRAGVSVVVLAAVLGATPGAVLASVLPDMTETRPGCGCPSIYCEPRAEGPCLCPRRSLAG